MKKSSFYTALATVAITGALLSTAAMAQDAGGATTPPAATTPSANAPIPYDPGHPRVNQVDRRDNRQQQRIDRGEADGQMSQGQAARDQAHLDRQEAVQQKQEAANGGHLRKSQERRDNHGLNRSSRKIHRQRHGGFRHRR